MQHLYGNVTFDHDDYPPFPILSRQENNANTPSVIQDDGTALHSNVLRLSNMILFNTLPAGQIVTRLTFIVNITRNCKGFHILLCLLLPQLFSLKNLTLESVSEDFPAWQHEHFPFYPLRAALSHTSQTLQSLDMFFSIDSIFSDGRAIGSLRHFSKLKYLSIQESVLLGPSRPGSPSLESVLPPGLISLRLQVPVLLCLETSLSEGGRNLHGVLENFVKDNLRIPRQTEEVVVQLNNELSSINPIYHTTRVLWEKRLPDLNEKARQGGLGLRFVLDAISGV